MLWFWNCRITELSTNRTQRLTASTDLYQNVETRKQLITGQCCVHTGSSVHRWKTRLRSATMNEQRVSNATNWTGTKRSEPSSARCLSVWLMLKAQLTGWGDARRGGRVTGSGHAAPDLRCGLLVSAAARASAAHQPVLKYRLSLPVATDQGRVVFTPPRPTLHDRYNFTLARSRLMITSFLIDKLHQRGQSQGTLQVIWQRPHRSSYPLSGGMWTHI